MASSKARKDKIFEKVINPYLAGVLQHPQSTAMREGMLHIRDVEGRKKNRSVKARLEAMEQQVFKCQGMVERGLKDNHMMITEFTNKHKIDANDIGKHLSRLYDKIDHLQAQIYDLQNQNCDPAPCRSVPEPPRAAGVAPPECVATLLLACPTSSKPPPTPGPRSPLSSAASRPESDGSGQIRSGKPIPDLRTGHPLECAPPPWVLTATAKSCALVMA
ncbi:40S ribosomal protein S5-1 [Hordeum vulgare]|nr:40S ribosomal protein S5-1 [Hordeum vulgare]